MICRRGISSGSAFLSFAKNCRGGFRVLRLMEGEAGRTEHLVAHAVDFRVGLAQHNSAIAALLGGRPVQGTPSASARLRTPTTSQRISSARFFQFGTC